MKKNLYYLLTVLFMFVIVSCNTTWDPFEDKDNADYSEIPFVDNATEDSVHLTESNLDSAVLATYDIFTMQVYANDILTDALFQIGFLPNRNSQNAYSKSPITDITTSTKTLLDSVRNRFQGLADSGNSTPIDCYDDGNYRYSINPSSIKLIFRECKHSGFYLDGEISFKYTSTYSQLEINKTFNLTSPSSNITYYKDYSLKHKPKTSTTSTKDEIELNGSINANINRAQYRYTFNNFLTEERRDSSSLKYDISGNFYTIYCNLEGWLNLDTGTSIDYKLIDNCPSNGELRIKGDNATVKVNVKFDESIDLYLDSSKFKSFGDCYDAHNLLSCSD